MSEETVSGTDRGIQKRPPALVVYGEVSTLPSKRAVQELNNRNTITKRGLWCA
jgi:hypothetical protein